MENTVVQIKLLVIHSSRNGGRRVGLGGEFVVFEPSQPLRIISGLKERERRLYISSSMPNDTL